MSLHLRPGWCVFFSVRTGCSSTSRRLEKKTALQSGVKNRLDAPTKNTGLVLRSRFEEKLLGI